MSRFTHIAEKLKRLPSYQPRKISGSNLRGSAVLIPIVQSGRGQLIFTMRSSDLKNHPGQISFPGGRIEEGERPWQAALREAEEEIGLNPSGVVPFGRLDDVISPRGFHIRSYVGLVEPFEPKLNRQEVESLVQVGLDELFDENLHETKQWRGYNVHYFHFKNGLVWGVTGQITFHLRQILRQS